MFRLIKSLPLHRIESDRPSAQAGFTLVELMVVLALVGIVAAIAAPSFSSFIANERLSSAANDLISDLMLARGSAATSGKHAIVCASINGTSCSNNASDWAIGRIVFVDKNANGAYDAGTDTLIKHTSGLSSGATITMSGFPNSYIAYGPYGGMSPLGTGKFKLCLNGASQCRQISVNYSGRASATKV